MARSVLLVAAAGAACVASSVLAVDFKLKARVDLFNTAVAQINGQPNPNRVGTNPSTIELVGDSLYIAGFNNGIGGTFNGSIVKATNIFTSPGNPTFTTFASRTVPLFYGFVGMDYQAGEGLLISYDAYNDTEPGQVQLYDVSGPTPTLVTSSPNGRGNSGPAWDNGYDGNGYAYPGGGSGAAVLTMVFGQPGVFGLNPLTLDSNLGATVYELGVDDCNLRLDFAGLSGTTWRDIDEHAITGTIAARANNDLVIGTRPTNNKNFIGQYLVDLGNEPFQAGQNLKIIDGLGDDDFIIYNNRLTGAPGQPFSSVVGFVKLDGTPATVNLLDADVPTPGYLAPGNAWYDFAWDAENQRLAILDFNDYYVYIYDLVVPNTCPADFTGDGFVDDSDFVIFAAAYEAFTVPPADPAADLNNDTFVDDFDFVVFAAAYESFVCP